MEVFGLVFIFVALFLIGVGIVCGVLACGIAVALVGIGIVSSSVIVGFLSRPRAGVRAFLLQCGLVAGVPAGIVCAWLAHYLFSAAAPALLISFYGAFGGAVAGLVIALLVEFASGQLHRWTSDQVVRGAQRLKARFP